MSIINNVLRDLELRPSQFTSIGVASAGNTVAPKPRQYMPTLLGLLLLSAILIGFWIYQQLQLQSPPVFSEISSAGSLEIIPVVETVIAAETLPIADVLEPVNQLIGMQFRETIDAISLEFSLREKVVSYLKERRENGFVFHLKNIDSEIVAPVISGNRWIEKLTITPQSGGLDISLKTLAGVLVETQQLKIGGGMVWAITLKKKTDPLKIKAVQSAKSDQSFDANYKKQESMDQPTAQAGTKAEKPGEVNLETLDEYKVVKLDIKTRNTASSEVQQLNKIRTLIQQRKYEKAEVHLLALLDGTEDLAARESLLVVYKRSKKSIRFGDLAIESLKRYPQHAPFITEYAQLLFQRGAYKKVTEFFQSQPNLNAMQLALIGASYQRLDQHQAAASFYQQSLKVDASQSRNWIALGLSEEHNANLSEALAAYSTAKKQGGLNTRLIEFVEQRSKILKKVIN